LTPSSSRLFRTSALALAISLGTSSCATVDNFAANNSGTVNCIAGGLLGAATGAAIGALTKGDSGAIVGGAAVGAAAGCGLALVYKSRVERLQKLAQEENLKLQVETLQTAGSTPSAAPEEAGIVAQVEDQGMFAVGSAELSVDGQRQVRKLASAFAGQADTAILVVGHTDATGSAQTNQKLSESRARAVASILVEQGIAAERMYFQGAGASRPVADNSDPLQRGKNRRVEIVEVNDRATLVQRVNAEQNNPKYLAHGTATEAQATPVKPGKTPQPQPSATSKQPAPTSTAQVQPSSKPASPHTGKVVDFGGQPSASSNWTLGQAIVPKSGGFAVISSAYAADIPMSSCDNDKPRQSGEVFNLASGQTLETRQTTDYLPGYNNRVWAQTVNGHLVTISPVSILRDAATVDRQPFIQVVQDYAQGNRKSLVKADAIANTYEGEDRVLYRVFLKDPQAPLSCMDVVFSKGSAQATDGVLVYPKRNGEAYTASFVPVRT
jgi:outer membrane protein OmpA-like peptidoglycan-associated protein